MLSDKQLIEDFISGNDIAFVSLYNRYKEMIYIFCCRMLSDKETAKDLTQEVFIKVYEQVEKLNNPDSFKYWIFKIARNDCLTNITKARRNVPFTPENELSITIDKEIEQSERKGLILSAIEKLKHDYREVILLREYQNYSYDEIANITSQTIPAVKAKLFKARKTLALLLRDFIKGDENEL